MKMGAITWTAAIGQMRGGTIIPLAVSSARRMPEFPDVPTLRELGYPDLAVTTWFGFAAPAGLAPDIAARMNHEIGAALDTEVVRKRLDADGFEQAKMSPAELTAFRAKRACQMAAAGEEIDGRRQGQVTVAGHCHDWRRRTTAREDSLAHRTPHLRQGAPSRPPPRCCRAPFARIFRNGRSG